MTPEALRQRALELLGDYGDPRAREVLSHATVSVGHGVRRWESSSGPVEAHRVTLALDAATLGALRAAHAVVDALQAAVSVAIAERPGEALLDLELRWSATGSPVQHGYRDAPPASPKPELRDAAVAYLEAGGEARLATALRNADVDATDEAHPIVVVRAAERLAIATLRVAHARLAVVLGDLLGRRVDSVRVRGA